MFRNEEEWKEMLRDIENILPQCFNGASYTTKEKNFMNKWQHVLPNGATITATSKQGIPYLDADIQPSPGRVLKVKFMLQNPNTSSKYAEMVRNGETIIWIFRREEPDNNKKWYGRLHNKKLHSDYLKEPIDLHSKSNIPEIQQRHVENYVSKQLDDFYWEDYEDIPF